MLCHAVGAFEDRIWSTSVALPRKFTSSIRFPCRVQTQTETRRGRAYVFKSGLARGNGLSKIFEGKPKHWRGPQAAMPPNTAPVLEFRECICCGDADGCAARGPRTSRTGRTRARFALPLTPPAQTPILHDNKRRLRQSMPQYRAQTNARHQHTDRKHFNFKVGMGTTHERVTPHTNCRVPEQSHSTSHRYARSKGGHPWISRHAHVKIASCLHCPSPNELRSNGCSEVNSRRL